MKASLPGSCWQLIAVQNKVDMTREEEKINSLKLGRKRGECGKGVSGMGKYV